MSDLKSSLFIKVQTNVEKSPLLTPVPKNSPKVFVQTDENKRFSRSTLTPLLKPMDCVSTSPLPKIKI